MRIIETFEVAVPSGRKVLRIIEGDIVDHASRVDMVIIPAGGYIASAFSRRGIAIPPFEQVLTNQRLEHRSAAKLEGVRYRCWVAGPLNDDQQFRVCVFEPLYFETVSQACRYLFESLVQLIPDRNVTESRQVRTMGLPILLAGQGGFTVDTAAPPLMRGLIHWLAIGLPLDGVDFVERNKLQSEKAAQILRQEVASYHECPIGARPPIRHDVFLSYSHNDESEANWIAHTLLKISPTLRLFRDVTSLRVGGIWQHELYVALDASKHVVTLLSPHYVASQFCLEEYNIVVLRDRQDRSNALFPVLLETATLPSYMQLRQHVDCRPRDRAKLTNMCQTLADKIVRNNS